MTTTDTEPTRWRKKPVEIDAWRVAELNHAAGHDWHALPDPTWHMFMSTWEHADELLPRVWGLLVQIRLGDALEVSDV